MGITRPAPGHMRAQWERAISEMTAAIKTKHYSVKTLRSYCHWIWKFQTFRKTLNPVTLTTDVRTTMIYTHCVPSMTVKEAKSPLDF